MTSRRLHLGALCLAAMACGTAVAQQEGQGAGTTESRSAAAADDPFAMHDLATELYAGGNVARARLLWDKAAGMDKNLPVADIQIVEELVKRGNHDGARVALGRAEKKYAQDPNLHVAKGTLAMAVGQNADAKTAFERAVALGPELVSTHLSLGSFVESTGDLAAAVKHYEQGTRIARSRPEGWAMLARATFLLGDEANARLYFEQARKLAPQRPSTEASFGTLSLQRGDAPGAYRWLTKAVAKAPQEETLVLQLASAERVLKVNGEGRPRLQELLKQGNNLQALIDLADLEQASGNLAEASQLCRRAIKSHPKATGPPTQLAMLLFMLDESPQEALKLVEGVLKQTPEDAAAKAVLGCVLVQGQGDAAQAGKLLAAAVRAAPSDPWLRFALGTLHARRQDADRAREHLQGVLLLDPEFPRKAEVQAALKALK